MKGLELPVNVLVVVAVAVIVLLGIVALYFAGFIGPSQLIAAQNAYSANCLRVSNSCGSITTQSDLESISLNSPVTFNGVVYDDMWGLCLALGNDRSLSQNPSEDQQVLSCKRSCGCSS